MRRIFASHRLHSLDPSCKSSFTVPNLNPTQAVWPPLPYHLHPIRSPEPPAWPTPGLCCNCSAKHTKWSCRSGHGQLAHDMCVGSSEYTRHAVKAMACDAVAAPTL